MNRSSHRSINSRISNPSRSIRQSRLSNDSQEIAEGFKAIRINANRRSSIFKPLLKLQPTFQLESKKPFNAYEVELLAGKIVESKMATFDRISLAENEMSKLAEELSSEILTQVKMKDYDRYRVIVFVDVVEKHHQSFKCGIRYIWDSEKDSIAKYVYERHNVVIIATVFGVYYD